MKATKENVLSKCRGDLFKFCGLISEYVNTLGLFRTSIFVLAWKYLFSMNFCAMNQ